MLLEIDPEPYRLTVQQAEADLAMARASLESRRRMLISERANSAIADEQLRRAEANHALAARTVKRLRRWRRRATSRHSNTTSPRSRCATPRYR